MATVTFAEALELEERLGVLHEKLSYLKRDLKRIEQKRVAIQADLDLLSGEISIIDLIGDPEFSKMLAQQVGKATE